MNDLFVPYALAGLALLGLGWLAWRQPTLLLAVALASLALRPQLLYGGPDIDFGWSWHQSLLLLALLVNALHFGLRPAINWPIIALLLASLLTVALGNLHPDLSPLQLVGTLALLMLPWCFSQVVLEPGSRHLLGAAIAIAPFLSVALSPFVQLVGMRAGTPFLDRLEGSTGNPEPFAILAFIAFAVALHETARSGRPLAPALAVLNLIFVILSGTRMAIFASLLMLMAYAALAGDFRRLIGRNRVAGGVALICVSLAFAWYWPTLEVRLFGRSADDLTWTADPAGSLQLSQRDQVWSVYLGEWRRSPWFGRGPGSGFIAAGKEMSLAQVRPHNEYVHLLASFGAIGGLLIAVAIVLWGRQVLRAISAVDRPFVIAIVPAFAALATTEDVLVFPVTLALFAYFSALLSRSTEMPPLKQEPESVATEPHDLKEAEERIRDWAERRRSRI